MRDKCIGCQLCYTACEDGAHQAIALSSDPANRIPSIIDEKLRGLQPLLARLPCGGVHHHGNAAMMARSTSHGASARLLGNIPKSFNDELAGGLHHWVPKPAEALTTKKPRHYRGLAVAVCSCFLVGLPFCQLRLSASFH